MCGIFAYHHYQLPRSKQHTVNFLLAGLRRLEYRGYDSAGLSFGAAEFADHDSCRTPCIIKSSGNIDCLAKEVCITASSENLCLEDIVTQQYGLAHTRWATHGPPSRHNSHPHTDEAGAFVVVHNGIITNYKALKELLVNHGRVFSTDTDTEVIPILCSYLYETRQPSDFKELMMEVISQLEGAFALLVSSSHYPEELMACKRGSPLVLGIREPMLKVSATMAASTPLQPSKWGAGATHEVFVASDVTALVEHTNRGTFAIFNGAQAASKVARDMQMLEVEVESIMKGNFKHFMQKEIFQQAESLAQTMQGRLRKVIAHSPGKQVVLGGLQNYVSAICRSRRVLLIACGSSYHACLAARQTMEELTHLPITCELASDLMDRHCMIFRDDTCIFVSQSGETADTLQALRYARKKGALCIGITNVVASAIARETECGVHVNAGCEIAVASTKAYTSQIVVLIMMAVKLSQDAISKVPKCCAMTAALEQLPKAVTEVLKLDGKIQHVAQNLKAESSLLVFGRGYNYATALEAALKVKEVALMHSEGILAGEMKHGPLALVDESMPVVVVATRDNMYAKMHAVIAQLIARGANLLILCNSNDKEMEALESSNCQLIQVPWCEPSVQPVINSIAMQLLSYHLAVIRGHSVDQPRNLAKSVTVADDSNEMLAPEQ